MVKPLALGLFAIAFLALAQGEARADTVNFIGSTAGCFNCGSGGPFAPTATLAPGLVYNNSTFNVTTNTRGDASIGNVAGNVNNLGSFSLSGAPGLYDGATFTLQVNFTAPSGINSPTFTATLTGLVESDTVGNLFVDFNNDFQTFTFNGGTFQFRVNDVSITPGGTIALSGDIRGATTVPEPMTMLLLGTGLTGVAAGVRRRRKAAGK